MDSPLSNVVSPPTRLGRFEVGAKIGGGGMASVYVGHAKRDDGSEERVALKVIRDELVHDEQFTAMFVDEAKILARLSHKNVIHTLEYGVTGHHRFIAMELLSGRTYADVWDVLSNTGGKMPLVLGAWICARVAEGLHSAHELVDDAGVSLNVIHRDVNPTNIFLTHEGDVKLIDFGLAKARVRAHKSADGIVKGKIPYLAPEQAQAKPIDRRIDVYSLGTTLWETVTMKRLFKRDTDVDTLRAIRDAVVPDPRETIEGFPDELWRIIVKSLERDRDARYATAEAFRADLDAFVSAEADKMPGELAMLLKGLFPGQEEKHVKWLRAATHVRTPAYTMPPPAPVPTASSTLLDQPENERDSVRPAAVAVALEKTRDDDKKKAKRSSRPPPPQKQKKKRKKKRRESERSEARLVHPSEQRDTAGPRKTWLTFAVVIAVLLAVGFLLANR